MLAVFYRSELMVGEDVTHLDSQIEMEMIEPWNNRSHVVVLNSQKQTDTIIIMKYKIGVAAKGPEPQRAMQIFIKI